jgi:ribosome-binding ATPase
MLIGLVGKPNVGKSTFFKAATLSDILIANYPFATIKANRGVGYVKVECIDKEFKLQCEPSKGYCIEGNRFVPVELMDVAGLVKGASEGKGLGNQFLDDLRQADVFLHIIDISGTTDEEGKTLDKGDYDPSQDIEMLENELDNWYLGILKKVWRTFTRGMGKEDNFSESVAKQFSGLKINEEDVKRAIKESGLNSDNAVEWNEEEIKKFSNELRKISKPMIIVANKIDLENGEENFKRLRDKFPDLVIMPCSADSELALKEADKHKIIKYIPGEMDFKVVGNINEKQEDALDNIRGRVLKNYDGGTGVQDILNFAVFSMLNYIAIFPAGVNKFKDSQGRVLPDCFLLPKGSNALDFAYSLHSDIGDNFIKAIDARSGKAVGKDHILEHRDALEIMTK